VSAEDEYRGSVAADRMRVRYLLDHEDAVDELVELRGKDSGEVHFSWIPVRDDSPQLNGQ
jgi:hypothetical protein